MTPNPQEEQLIQAAKAGDAFAMDALFARYKSLVRAKASMYYISGGDRDDLIQEGMIGLYKAFLDYDPQRNPVFAAFASLCINRQIQTAIKSAARQKHAPLNAAQTLDVAEAPAGIAANVTSAASTTNPEILFLGRESIKNIALFIREHLSPLERDVLLLHINDQTHAQIAQRMGKTVKSVDNTLQRVRRKVRVFRDGGGG
ncbi:MAG: sigma-70 family RNA polymerase sigma factor [Defluviitaleaceae bacterium]|nr:sigma-70 family RNA polymerase sigma factor [Defluviitaleaceae bacterium]